MTDVHSVCLDAGSCVLRPFRQDDRPSLVWHANSRGVWLGVRDRFPHPYTDEHGRHWLNMIAAEEPLVTLAIDLAGEAVGAIGIVPGVDESRHTAEMGFWLGESVWGRGIMTAAVRAFRPWVCETRQLDRLFAHVFARNLASVRVLEKCGFEREGVMRLHARKDDVLQDEYVYGWISDGRP